MAVRDLKAGKVLSVQTTLYRRSPRWWIDTTTHLPSTGLQLNRRQATIQQLAALSIHQEIRAGIGKMRGRKYQRKKGLLVVVSNDCPLIKAANNLSGIDVVPVASLNAELLAPGAMPGRASLWTEKAVDVINENKLFI